MNHDTSLHFVTLVGSLRKGSYNAALARALPGFAPAGVTITPLASVSTFPHYNADVQAEGFPAAVTEMAEQIKRADGVIIVTPEYNYSVPGVLKNALDWLSRLSPQPFVGKPVAIQSASPGVIGGARAQYHLRQTLVFLEALAFNKPEVMVSQVNTKMNDKLELTDAGTRDQITNQLKAFAAFAQKAKSA